MLAVGGKSNSLGRANEVIEVVLNDQPRLKELYECVFDEDAWVRMRAVDSLEKVCRIHPEWILPYIDGFNEELATSRQPSIQWHLAQMYREVVLTDVQKQFVIKWLKQLLSSNQIDWIVAANAMDTIAQFTTDGLVSKAETLALLKIQQSHTSKSVVKRANKLLSEL